MKFLVILSVALTLASSKVITIDQTINEDETSSSNAVTLRKRVIHQIPQDLVVEKRGLFNGLTEFSQKIVDHNNKALQESKEFYKDLLRDVIKVTTDVYVVVINSIEYIYDRAKNIFIATGRIINDGAKAVFAGIKTVYKNGLWVATQLVDGVKVAFNGVAFVAVETARGIKKGTKVLIIKTKRGLQVVAETMVDIIKVGTIVALAGVLAVFDGIAWVAAKTGKLVFDGVDAVYSGGKWIARKAYRGINAGAIIFYNGVEWVAEVIVQGTKAIIDGLAAIYVGIWVAVIVINDSICQAVELVFEHGRYIRKELREARELIIDGVRSIVRDGQIVAVEGAKRIWNGAHWVLAGELRAQARRFDRAADRFEARAKNA